MTKARKAAWLVLSVTAIAVLAAIVWRPNISHAAPDGVLLTGTVKSATGEKMGGVTVSAKIGETTVTTSVYTDEQGNYYFPPMQDGKYQVWAQAVGFEA